TLMPEDGLDPPEAFLRAREELFERIKRSQYEVEGEPEGAITALCDLRGLRAPIARYLREWAAALATPDPSLLRTLLALDQIELSDSELSSGVLVGPTHPLRIAWLARYQDVLEDWAEREAPDQHEASEVRAILATLAPGNLPHILIGPRGKLRYLEPIDLYW